jgi:biotin-(acetyl-CoA carboxylase) ligase
MTPEQPTMKTVEEKLREAMCGVGCNMTQINTATQICTEAMRLQSEKCAQEYFENPRELPEKTHGDIMEIIRTTPQPKFKD